MTGVIPKIKICGLSTPETMTAALEGIDGHGADFVGLVFYPPSPRYVETAVASYLAAYVPQKTAVTGLFVDPDDQLLDEILNNVRLDMLQLHGLESPDRVRDLRDRFKKPIIKALSIGSPADVKNALLYEGVADWLLLDAPPSSIVPGGAGVAFDWTLLDGFQSKTPWMLAGGLTPETVGEAVQRTGAPAVDVSSGVESARGIKDTDKIRAFIKAVRGK